MTRNGNNWTATLKPLHGVLKKLKLPDGWYDGEIVVINVHGVPDFGARQNAFDVEGTQKIVYYLFDLPGIYSVLLIFGKKRDASCIGMRGPDEGEAQRPHS